MSHLGQDLRHERELRGISLKQISESTRISLRYLEALENDRFEVIPGRFFVRAILRSYALALGLEETHFLSQYDESTQFNEQLEYKEAGPGYRPARSGRTRRLPAVVILSVLVVAAALLYVFVIAPRRAGSPASKAHVRAHVQVQAQAPAAPAQAAPPTVTPAPVTTPAPAAEEVKGLRLDVSFTEETWLAVYADGRLAWNGIKRAGDALEVKAERELVLNSGNCGGMSFTLNGKRTRPFGQRGEVRQDVRITLDNAKEFLLPEGTG